MPPKEDNNYSSDTILKKIRVMLQLLDMLILKCIFECINSTNVSCWFTVATLCATVKVRPVKYHGLLVSLTDFANFSRLTTGRHNAHGYCKDVPQISRIVAHDCTDVNGSRTRLTALVDKSITLSLIETCK